MNRAKENKNEPNTDIHFRSDSRRDNDIRFRLSNGRRGYGRAKEVVGMSYPRKNGKSTLTWCLFLKQQGYTEEQI